MTSKFLHLSNETDCACSRNTDFQVGVSMQGQGGTVGLRTSDLPFDTIFPFSTFIPLHIIITIEISCFLPVLVKRLIVAPKNELCSQLCFRFSNG